MKNVLIIISLSFISFQNFAQRNNESIHNKINKGDLKNFVEILSSDSLQGRLTGSKGQKKAAKIIANRFSELGLIPVNSDSYFEKFQLKQSYWGEIYLKTDKKTLNNGDGISFLGFMAQNEEKKVDLVFGGNGSEEELNKIDVKNRLVLIFSENMRASYQVSEDLISRNAYGIILANPSNKKQFNSIKNSQGNFMLKKRIGLPERDSIKATYLRFFQEFVISNNQIKALMGVSLKSLKKFISTNSIENCSLSTVHLKCERFHEPIETENVVGVIPGYSNKSIIISAHYDHLGNYGEIYYPGADDNASGTAALLELAEVFSQKKDLKYNIIFLATSAEEQGLLGSEYHVNKEDFDCENILINLNIDMIGRNDKNYNSTNSYIYAIGTGLYPNLIPYFEKADSIYTECLFDYSLNNGTNCPTHYRHSDQFSFYEKEIPAIMFFSGLHNDYHTPRDIALKINFDVLTHRVKLISHVVDQLQNGIDIQHYDE